MEEELAFTSSGCVAISICDANQASSWILVTASACNCHVQFIC